MEGSVYPSPNIASRFTSLITHSSAIAIALGLTTKNTKNAKKPLCSLRSLRLKKDQQSKNGLNKLSPPHYPMEGSVCLALILPSRLSQSKVRNPKSKIPLSPDIAFVSPSRAAKRKRINRKERQKKFVLAASFAV
jgi:hypothetical protein